MTSPSEMVCANLGPILCFRSSGPHPIKAALKSMVACLHSGTVFSWYFTLGETTQNLWRGFAPLVVTFPSDPGVAFEDGCCRFVCAETLVPSFLMILKPRLMRKLLVCLPPLPVPRDSFDFGRTKVLTI